MAFQDLEQELKDLFSQVQLDRFDREGISVHNLEPDKENRRNYGRWYRKQVYYPKNREILCLKAKQNYLYHKLMNDEFWKKRLKGWKEKNIRSLIRGTKEYKSRLAANVRYKRKRYAQDPEWRKKELDRHKRVYKKRMADPEKHKRMLESQKKWRDANAEKRRAYQKAYRERKKLGQKTASSS